MGAEQFTVIREGDTANAAFLEARDDAAWDHGHGGYTGTIAEKDGFTLFHPAPGFNPEEVMDDIARGDFDAVEKALGSRAQEAIDTFDNKWGDAVCIPLGENRFFFGGWASC